MNIVFFDWDDTIFPASWLINNDQLSDTSPDTKTKLKHLSKLLCNLFDSTTASCKCYIITNSTNNWVKLTSEKFMPDVIPYLETMPIISARELYEPLIQDDPIKWKYYAMQKQIMNLYKPGTLQKIISIGDGNDERQAMLNLIESKSGNIFKIIKLQDNNICYDKFITQIEFLTNNFSKLTTGDKNIDMKIH